MRMNHLVLKNVSGEQSCPLPKGSICCCDHFRTKGNASTHQHWVLQGGCPARRNQVSQFLKQNLSPAELIKKMAQGGRELESGTVIGRKRGPGLHALTGSSLGAPALQSPAVFPGNLLLACCQRIPTMMGYRMTAQGHRMSGFRRGLRRHQSHDAPRHDRAAWPSLPWVKRDSVQNALACITPSSQPSVSQYEKPGPFRASNPFASLAGSWAT